MGQSSSLQEGLQASMMGSVLVCVHACAYVMHRRQAKSDACSAFANTCRNAQLHQIRCQAVLVCRPDAVQF